MQKYLFILGRNPELSILETASFLQAQGIKHKINSYNKKAILLEIETKNIQTIQKKLGSIVKIGKPIIETEKKKLEQELEKIELIQKKKFFYTINNLTEEHNISNFLNQYLKKRFKKEKTKAVLKHGKHEIFSNPSQVITWKLIETETDYLIYLNENKIILGKTITCSNPKELEKRDLKKPEHSPLQAISLRLAKILVNLTQTKKGDTILDPFCGIGTIMQEAMLLGKNTIGIDQEKETIRKAKKNLEWFQETYKNSNNYKLFEGKAEEITKFVKKIDAIATEPYLGPLISNKPTEEQAKNTIKKLEKIYEQMFKQTAKIIKTGNIVIILPQIVTNKGKKIKTNEQIFLKHGFRIHTVLSELRTFNPYLYKDEDSKIERLIYILRKH